MACICDMKFLQNCLKRLKIKNNGLADKNSLVINLIREHCGSISGKRVLDIGTNTNGSLLSSLVKELNVSEAIGVNPALKKPISGKRWSAYGYDARELPYETESFNICLSVAAFEHFSDLNIALIEAHRVLEPGGILLTTFGPIWSGCWGHHLWIKYKGSLYTYLNTTLPPFSHLLWSEDEMHSWWHEKYQDDELANVAINFIYKSSSQNRLFYDDYIRIFNDSPFKIKLLRGNEGPRSKRYSVIELKNGIENVKKKFPDRSGFEFDSITAILIKQ